MQRYFIKNNYRQNDIIIADDSMYKHMTKVMRMEKGEHVICIDEDKHVCLCEIIDLKRVSSIFTILLEARNGTIRLTPNSVAF